MMLRKLNKKGVLGLDTAKGFILSILTLTVIAFAILIALNSLQSTGVGTAETSTIINNVTNGVSAFFGEAVTWFTLLAVVVIILIIAIVILAVNRFSGTAGGGL